MNDDDDDDDADGDVDENEDDADADDDADGRDCMIFISVYKNTNLKINGSRNDIACFLLIVQASVTSRPSVFFLEATKAYIFTHSKG